MFLRSRPKLQRCNGNGLRAAITDSLMGAGVQTPQPIQFIIKGVNEIYNISKSWDHKNIEKCAEKTEIIYRMNVINLKCLLYKNGIQTHK